MTDFPLLLRLRPADGYVREGRLYHLRCVMQAAAKIWVEGVEWEKAKALASSAIEKAEPQVAKGKGRGGRKGHAKGGRKGK